jgi:hypothetical protein
MTHRHVLPGSVLLVIVSLLMAGPVIRAQEQPAPWTAAGSTGTVDEADLLRVLLGSPVPGAVALRPGGLGIRGTAVRIRYNVVAVQGILGTFGLTLTSRFLDRGDFERVIVEFKQYGLNTGLTTTLLTLDSNSFAGSPTFQVQQVQTAIGPGCVPFFTPLNFAENSYFMDVTLSRSLFDLPPVEPPIALFLAIPEPPSNGPALGMIKLENASCIEIE